jgi:prepilin-type N-terminal cleavage/methylation domain-containing protein
MRAFTLMELTVVAVIVGIVATIGVSQYGITRERALRREAIANLRIAAAAERIYRTELGNFYNGPTTGSSETDPAAINSFLRTDLRETNWDYFVCGTATTFAITATRLAPFPSCVVRMDETMVEPVNGSTCR